MEITDDNGDADFDHHFRHFTGADPGFLEGGIKYLKRGFVFNILLNFS